jgi:hypothetical protein
LLGLELVQPVQQNALALVERGLVDVAGLEADIKLAELEADAIAFLFHLLDGRVVDLAEDHQKRFEWKDNDVIDHQHGINLRG